MRLLNVQSLGFETFFGEVPPYTILSHTWGTDEVAYEDFKTGNPDKDTSGYRKILQACERTKCDGYRFVWIDTCCIDKSSSAELSESINSMYRWYQASEVCYVFLTDVRDADDICNARWFKRGWTLQELLAPSKVLFYNQDWQPVGTKHDSWRLISEITGIDKKALVGDSFLGVTAADFIASAGITERMSWASMRKTTREEDTAYCLIGLFAVNIPLLYGEGGTKAFYRLQEEIIRQSTEHSILAWQPQAHVILQRDVASCELLAQDPSMFSSLLRIRPSKEHLHHFTLNNNGLEIQLPVFRRHGSRNRWVAILSCFYEKDLSCAVGLPIRAIDRSERIFVRERQVLEFVTPSQSRRARIRDICIQKSPPSQNRHHRVLWVRQVPDTPELVKRPKNLARNGEWGASGSHAEISQPKENPLYGIVFDQHHADGNYVIVVIVTLSKEHKYAAKVAIHRIREDAPLKDDALLDLSSFGSDSSCGVDLLAAYGRPRRSCSERENSG